MTAATTSDERPVGEPTSPPDPYAARLALGVTGVLRELNESGVLDAADAHVARRLAELSGEGDERVVLAAALAVRGVRTGSVCVDLADVAHLAPDFAWPDPDSWVSAVVASPLVGEGKPLRWHDHLLYLERYWHQESAVCADLVARDSAAPPTVDVARLDAALARLFPAQSWAEQRTAAQVAATRWVTVVGGGPGTGKTTTVARLLAILADQPGPPLRVALAAPTGKAAARLQEAVTAAASGLPAGDRSALRDLSASTIHRLLGWRPGGRFRHDADNRLPYDVVVVDETSMVSLTLMAQLLAAVRPDARLVLVGDPDQLASIEAGAVLADVVAGLQQRARAASLRTGNRRGGREVTGHSGGGVVVLRHTWRFDGAIAELAAAIRDGATEDALAVLAAGRSGVLHSAVGAREEVVSYALAVRNAAESGDVRGALEALARHRVLCAHRAGSYGVSQWNLDIERWLSEEIGTPLGAATGAWSSPSYAGRPLLVTANDYALGLFNGDTGVVVRTDDGTLRAAFQRGGAAEEIVSYAPGRLSDVMTCHAMTVHRSQGSQFERVTLVLPTAESQLTTRELLYTAVTRASDRVRIIGTAEAIAAAIDRPAVRASGLRDRLATA